VRCHDPAQRHQHRDFVNRDVERALAELSDMIEWRITDDRPCRPDRRTLQKVANDKGEIRKSVGVATPIDNISANHAVAGSLGALQDSAPSGAWIKDLGTGGAEIFDCK